MFGEGNGLPLPAKIADHLLAPDRLENAALRADIQTIAFVGGPCDGTTMNVSKLQPVMRMPYHVPVSVRCVGPPYFTPPFPEFRTLQYRQSRFHPCRYIFDEDASDIPIAAGPVLTRAS